MGGQAWELLEADLDVKLAVPTDMRMFRIAEAFRRGYTIERVHELTRIDPWFLSKLARISAMWRALDAWPTAYAIPVSVMRKLKQCGFSDRQIAARYVGDICGI